MIIALLFLAAAFVVFFDLVQPSYGTMEDSRSKLIGEQESFATEKALVSQAKSLIAAFASGNGQQPNVALAIPTGEDVAGALAQVEGIAQNDNVSITNITIGSPMLHAAAAGSLNQAGTSGTVKPIQAFTLALTGSGSYEGLKNFLTALETNIRIFDVQNFSIQPMATVAGATKNATPVSRDLFNYNMTIETYYQLP